MTASYFLKILKEDPSMEFPQSRLGRKIYAKISRLLTGTLPITSLAGLRMRTRRPELVLIYTSHHSYWIEALLLHIMLST
jgi:hypothetical protein